MQFSFVTVGKVEILLQIVLRGKIFLVGLFPFLMQIILKKYLK